MIRRNFESEEREDKVPLAHPGKFLLEELMIPKGVSVSSLAEQAGISERELSAIVAGDREIDQYFAEKIGAYFGTSTEFWINLQDSYTAKLARRRK